MRMIYLLWLWTRGLVDDNNTIMEQVGGIWLSYASGRLTTSKVLTAHLINLHHVLLTLMVADKNKELPIHSPPPPPILCHHLRVFPSWLEQPRLQRSYTCIKIYMLAILLKLVAPNLKKMFHLHLLHKQLPLKN